MKRPKTTLPNRHENQISASSHTRMTVLHVDAKRRRHHADEPIVAVSTVDGDRHVTSEGV